MSNYLSSILKLLIIYFAICLLVSINKNEMIINVISDENKSILRLSSYISSIVSLLIITFMMLIMFLTTWYIANLNQVNCNEASRNAIKIFIINSFLKFVLLWLLLWGEIKHNEYDINNFEQNINATDFFKIDQLFNAVFPVVALAIFCYTLYKNKVSTGALIFTSAPMVILIVINLF